MRNPTTAWGGVKGEARRVRAWVKAASSLDGKDDEDREEDDHDEDRHSKDAITSRRALAVVVVVEVIVEGVQGR
jgi:hypothetical protein